MKKHKVHYRNIRLYNNAGIAFPQCYVDEELLDLEKTALPTSGYKEEVTCKRCLRYLNKRGW